MQSDNVTMEQPNGRQMFKLGRLQTMPPTLPPSLSEFDSLLQQQDMIPPSPQHENIGEWKDSGVVPSSMRNWEMSNSHCCCYLFGPCPVAAAGTREIPPRSIAAEQPIHPEQRSDCPPQQLQKHIVLES